MARPPEAKFGLANQRSSTAPFAYRLLPGETIVWVGRPRQGFMLTRLDVLLVPFSLLWGGFAIFWETMVLSTTKTLAFALFGVPFVAIGLFLIFGRFVLDAWLRAHTSYALTDRRVLIARTGLWPSFTALALDRLPEATLIEGSKGRGTIRFGPAMSMWGGRNGGAGFSYWTPALDPTPRFLAIEDVDRVFAAVQERAHAGRA